MVLALLTCAGSCPAAAQAPDEDWRTLRTEHFRVTYPVELRSLATKTADRAERAFEGLSTAFADPPTASIDIVVTDHQDVSNGFARVSPSNRVTIFAPPPLEGYELAYFDDWLELVITHELAHIFHLDKRGWLGDVVKGVFGRPPIRWPVFPSSAMPSWIVEGLATYYESDLTQAGRTRGSYHDMVIRTAVLEGRFESMDQVAGESQVWPSGNRPYIYGSLFFDHLTDEHGADRMGEFAAAVEDQIIPFLPNAAARKSFGTSFKDAFQTWKADLGIRYDRVITDVTTNRPLTPLESVVADGRRALSSSVSPDGAKLAFAQSNGWSDVQIRLIDLATGEGSKLTRTNGTALLDWTPDGSVLFAQTEFVDPYRRYKDLYVAGPGGSVRRVTQGARLDFPAASPDGRTALAIQQKDGNTWPVTVDLQSGGIERLVEPDPAVLWAYPTWSPDGRWIAISRWEPGAYYDIVILDARGREVDVVTQDRAVDQAPTWSPDGAWLLWTSDRTGIPNIFAVSVDANGQTGSPQQVTNVATGVSYPDVSPDGEWLYVSTYHADGWHIERTPFRPASWGAAAAVDPRFATESTEATAAAEFGATREALEEPYNPFPSFWPRYWEPTYREGESRQDTQVIGPSFGLQTAAFDLVERHRVNLSLRYEPKGSRFNGGIAYTFAGLGNPALGVSAQQSYGSRGILVQDTTDSGDPVDLSLFEVERRREVRGSVRFDRVRVRNQLSLTLGAGYRWESRDLLDSTLAPEDSLRLRRPTSGLPVLSATVGFNTSRFHPFSISREDGVRGFVRGSRRWDATVPDSMSGQLGLDASVSEVTGELRAYKGFGVWGFANHVFALRLSGGAAGDTGADQFHFSVGGASGQGEGITGLEVIKGSNLLFPVRGYARGIRSGRYAWTGSAEYRFPVARINRGIGDFPLFFDWIAGSLFLDAGNAWGPELGVQGFENPQGSSVASVGGEVLLVSLPFWTVSTVFRTGLAMPLIDGDGAHLYLRLGLAF